MLLNLTRWAFNMDVCVASIWKNNLKFLITSPNKGPGVKSYFTPGLLVSQSLKYTYHCANKARAGFGEIFASSQRGARGLSPLPPARTKPSHQPSETVGYRELRLHQAEATTLLHESPDSKPETIEQRKIVFHHVRVRVARVRVVPLVRAEPAQGESRRGTRVRMKSNVKVEEEERGGCGGVD